MGALGPLDLARAQAHTRCNGIPRRPVVKPAEPLSALVIAAALAPQPALAFRNCESSVDSGAFRGSSHYLVGELVFDSESGSATGTETHYNYSNADATGVSECHVTYDIDGIYQADAGLFMLEARRVNQSRSCDEDFIVGSFPETRAYVLLARLQPGGQAELLLGDSGETLALGNWSEGSLSYKTREVCELF